MASHATLVLQDLLTALRADLGVYDLSTVSSTPKVVIADGGPPPIAPPYILISAPGRKASYDRSPLTEYHQVYVCEWWAYVASAADTTESRAFAALDLASEVVGAIHTAHQTSSFTALYALTTLVAGWDHIFADEPNIPGFVPYAQGTIEFSTDLQRGA